MNHRFTKKERECIAHAISEMKANPIADDDYCGSGGWYFGNKQQFIKRHKESIETLKKLVCETKPSKP